MVDGSWLHTLIIAGMDYSLISWLFSISLSKIQNRDVRYCEEQPINLQRCLDYNGGVIIQAL